MIATAIVVAPAVEMERFVRRDRNDVTDAFRPMHNEIVMISVSRDRIAFATIDMTVVVVIVWIENSHVTIRVDVVDGDVSILSCPEINLNPIAIAVGVMIAPIRPHVDINTVLMVGLSCNR